jgi:hypothetical protein
MDRMTFKKWFQYWGDDLLKCWLRAKEDGNKESFQDWVVGEYEYFKRDSSRFGGYEVPYSHNDPSVAELFMFTELARVALLSKK